jgi:hypothetical protein
MPADFEAAIIAILDSQERIQGTGFLVADHLAVTCDHVVRSCGAGPGDSIQIKFHSIKETFSVKVSSEYWDEAQDVAFLHLDAQLPESVKPVQLGSSSVTTGQTFTQAEWQTYFPDETYRLTCPQWPAGE